MVRQGKDKKRRSGRTGRTKLKVSFSRWPCVKAIRMIFSCTTCALINAVSLVKNRSYKRWNPKPAFSDGLIKAQWNTSKTPAQNMKSLGLSSKPGEEKSAILETPFHEPKKTVIELYDVPDSDTLEARKQKRPQSAEDQKYIVRLVAKHGDDFTAMFRDIKLNNMQHTETQLRKMASRFLLLDEEQRVVLVPDCMKEASHEID